MTNRPRFSRISRRPQAEVKSAPPVVTGPLKIPTESSKVNWWVTVLALDNQALAGNMNTHNQFIEKRFLVWYIMIEPRRHQRIRFCYPPAVKIGYGGQVAHGVIENLSLSGLMVRAGLEMDVGRRFGCEFSIFGSPNIDVVAVVVNRVGDLISARFDVGPLSEILLDEIIVSALADGHASILTNHEIDGRRVMRITGGLTGNLRNDFIHSLTRVKVDEIDVSAVTAVDQAGMALCLTAMNHHGVTIGKQSSCFARNWAVAQATARQV